MGAACSCIAAAPCCWTAARLWLSCLLLGAPLLFAVTLAPYLPVCFDCKAADAEGIPGAPTPTIPSPCVGPPSELRSDPSSANPSVKPPNPFRSPTASVPEGPACPTCCLLSPVPTSMPTRFSAPAVACLSTRCVCHNGMGTTVILCC